MNGITRPSVLVGVLIGGLLGAGCRPERAIEIHYQRPAQYEISPRVRRIGIAEFGGQTPQDKQWGHIASDRLAAELDAYNRKYNRYELVDRKRLKALLDERDLQIAISDGPSAGEAGKLANVHAMIYGSVKVTTRDERASRKTLDPIARRLKTIYYTRRYCLAAVNFTMDDISTGKALASVSATQDYDSEKDTKSGAAGIGKALGFVSGELPPTDKVVNQLINDCVNEFLTKISPHQVTVQEKLQSGKSKIVDTGNKLAVAGDHAEALEWYETAIQQDRSDHGAVFNAAVMHEAMGDLAKAEEMYTKAFKTEPKERYVLARKRVRLEGDR